MKENEFGVILEDINGKLDRLAESMSTLATKASLRKVEEKVDKVADNVDVIKNVVTGQSGELARHEGRITELEAA